MSHVQDLVKKYVSLLGISGETFPTSFDVKHEQSFNVFAREFPLKATGERNALFLALEFVRYMKSVGIGVFTKSPVLVKMSETPALRFSPASVYEQLLVASLKDTATDVLETLRKTMLFRHFSIIKSKISVDGVRDLTLTHYVELDAKKESLDAVLSKLQGHLYNSSDVPIQLREQYTKVPVDSRLKARIVTPSAFNRMSDTSSLGWFCLRKTKEFSVYVSRAAKGRLVMRITVPIVPVTLGFVVNNTVKSIVPKYWAAIFKKFT